MKFHRFSSVFRYTLGAGRCAFALAVCLLVPLSAAGQVNPVPFVNQPLVPAAVAPGAEARVPHKAEADLSAEATRNLKCQEGG